MEISSNCYQSVVNNFGGGILLLDSKCQIRYWNLFMEQHSGKSADEVNGLSLFEIFPDIAKTWFKERVQTVLDDAEIVKLDWEMRPHLLAFTSSDASGGKMFQNCDLFPANNGDSDKNQEKLVCMVVLDVTSSALYQIKLSKTLMALEKISRLDGLTELYNRSYWDGRLNEEFSRSRRYPDSGDMTLLMFDIDFFKLVNDDHGHLVGDQVLKVISAIIQDMFRNIDIPGRYGGEEFVIILPKTNIEGALIAAERLKDKIAATVITYEGGSLSVTVSIGLAQFDKEMTSAVELIARADSALYDAKDSGRNNVKVYQPG